MTEDKLRAIAAGYNLVLVSYSPDDQDRIIRGGYLLLDQHHIIVAGAATLDGLWHQLRHLPD